MKLIIDIPDADYTSVRCEGLYYIGHDRLAQSVTTAFQTAIPYEERPQGDTISREALKKAINDNGCRHSFYFDVFDVIDDAPAVEEKSTDEWVPISERLPIRNGVYNVTRKLKEGETIYFISDASYFDGQNTWHRDVCVNHGRPYLTDIVAWQELPESYKGDGAV